MTAGDEHGARRAFAARIALAIAASAIAVGIACVVVRHGAAPVQVSRDVVTGPAAAAIGDSGIFDLRGSVDGAPHVIARADAESAAVAFAYGWEAPSNLVFSQSNLSPHRIPHAEIHPLERRSVCDRSYHVRPVVAMPDTLSVRSPTSDVTVWGPIWVVPICNDGGSVKAIVLVADMPMAVQVVVGDRPGAVPELTFPDSTFPHIGMAPVQMMDGQGRGIGLSPERAVAAAVSALAANGGVHVREVPDAFPIIMSVPAPTPGRTQALPQGRECPRWRLRLDRDVRLRGRISGQVVSTATVYVSRDKFGCGGDATLEIPRPNQPTTLPYAYGVYAPMLDSTAPVPGRRAPPRPIEFRSTALRVTEPIWFEPAQLAPR